ncbi:MAG: chromosomal replication initiator protein DnaA [Chloroflexi bacterium]|jgi:chromosomal replication initiator protein|nr:chromosomal replication initiator protein DnaA [Chloroflexota bacterium]
MPGSNNNGQNFSFDESYNSNTESQTLVDFSSRSGGSFNDTRQIWQIALRDLYIQLERHDFDSWIKNLTLLEINQGTALIAAPTSYACRRLEQDFGEVISQVLSGVVSENLQVQFTVEAPVQAQLFDPSPPSANTRSNFNANNGQPRPAPTPGIRAKGPYLNLEQSGNGRSSHQPRSSATSQYGQGGRSKSSSSSPYGIKSRPTDLHLNTLNPYNYSDELPEPDSDMMGVPGNPPVEQPSDYEAQAIQFGLNPRYVFDKYIVGSSNRMAAAAGRSVAENPGNSYNPLFIYGGVGLGKTHLLHAIGHEALRLRPYLKIMYVSSEKFTNDLINGIREQRMEEFRNRYRSMDILMIDDIQFIAGKDQTQEEFFHTFNTLVEANKQVVISSDRSPKSMLTLEDRLRSRFEGGLIADVSLPDYEMRLLILQAKAKYQQIHIPQEVMEFIAHKIPSNIRELEGALIRVVAFGFLNKMAISVDLAAQALNDSLLNSRKKLVTKERIIEAVANFYNVEMKDLLGKSRSADIVLPRQVSMYIIREQTDHSLVEIGQSLGGRDHTTIMHGLDKIEQALDSNIQLRQQINTITQIVYNGEGK